MDYINSFDIFGVAARQRPSIVGSGAPADTTAAAVGDFYLDAVTGDVYVCKAATGSIYVWECVSKAAAPRELPYSWEEISQKCKNGDFSGINIGDYKTIQVGSETVVCEVAGIDTYYNRSAGYPPCDKHHIDFISRDCLGSVFAYNGYPTNNGTADAPNPFMASNLYWSLNAAGWGVIAKLPADLTPYMISKRCCAEARFLYTGPIPYNSAIAWYDMGLLWLPTEVEIWGRNTHSESGVLGANSGCNIQYPIFKDGLKHILKAKGNGNPFMCNWWVGSAAIGTTEGFCCVGSDGMAASSRANNEYCVPLCFRIA